VVGADDELGVVDDIGAWELFVDGVDDADVNDSLLEGVTEVANEEQKLGILNMKLTAGRHLPGV